MKLSIVIPTYTLTKELELFALLCINSLKGENVKEIIVCEDGGMYSEELKNASDIYLYTKENQGFTKNVNKGVELSTGDYIGIVNSDTRLVKGDISKLCIPDKVACPITRGQDVPGLAGHFFVVPRAVFLERWEDEAGLLDERMRNFCSDTDFERKVKNRIVHVDDVVIDHEINATIKVAGLMDGKQLEEDRKIYHEFLRHSD